MTPELLLKTAIVPALGLLAQAGIPDTLEARRFLLTIALQESGLRNRRQVVGGTECGPAVSWFQFEKGGGCRGVLTHKLTAQKMAQVCALFKVDPTEGGLWEAMRYQDIVAVIAARLLVYTLPHSLPVTADEGWAQYVEAWRPGAPRPETWAGHWATADHEVRSL